MTNPQCAGIEYCSVRTDCEAGAVVDIIPQHLAAKTSNEGVNLENRIPARQVRSRPYERHREKRQDVQTAMLLSSLKDSGVVCLRRAIHFARQGAKQALLRLTMERGIMIRLLPGTTDRVADLGL